MKTSFLALFLFVLCTQAISTSDLPSTLTSQQRGLNFSNSNVLKQEALAAERCMSKKEGIKMDRKLEEKKNEAFADNRKAQGGGGRGAGGGSNVNHRPRRYRNSAAKLTQISTLVLHVTLALTFLFSFQLF